MNHLLVFTRYPQAGKSKTRLIPAIGPQQASQIHRQLTEWTLATVRQWWQADQHDHGLKVWFTGGTPADMAHWLGADLDYLPQVEGDLGQRMASACEHSFVALADRVVIIGSDCPQITVSLLQDAFTALDRSDLVLGPATDGGYYLIGMQRFWPELFANIAWGTDQVLQATMQIGQAAGLQIRCLEVLTDIDRPEDLIWLQENVPGFAVEQ